MTTISREDAQPYGPLLLLAVGTGAAFGVYSFAESWARRIRTDVGGTGPARHGTYGGRRDSRGT